MEKITKTSTKYELKPGTKTVYQPIETRTEDIDRLHYNNFVEAAPFFRRLGGSETLNREYTCRGYLVTEVISKSPDKQTRRITTFKFE